MGGGISGYGSAILARRKGFDVFLSDSGRIADRYRMKLEAWGVPYEEGGHSEERILAASECVKSPGIPDSAPIVRKLRERGVPVISEIEFAGRYLDGARTICITGSNGKTTTTSLVYRILRDAPWAATSARASPIRSQPAGMIGMCWNSARSSWTACSGSGPTSVC